jgi:hypothetical protein
MSKFSLLTMVAIAGLTACSAAARAQADGAEAVTQAPLRAESIVRVAPASAHTENARQASHNEAVTCEVRARRTANGLLIQARAFADRNISGEYDLVITKSGGAGSSDISQSGALDLSPGSPALLGESEISVERGARVRATLTLRDESGQLCRRSFNL